MANIALLGHGVVGSGTARVLLEKKDEWPSKVGEDLILKYILVRHDYGVDYKDLFVYDMDTILDDETIDVVVEVMGGTDPAYKYVKAALQRGKSVVTSNKQLVAEHGFELMNIAFEKNVNFLFEGAVAGAVPVIHSVRNTLMANDVKEICGIINGTTNFILSKMVKEGMSFDDALKDAQRLGYAEADPSRDVDGLDTCRKICILATLCFGSHVYPYGVHTEGIRKVRIEDIRILSELGKTVKLLGYARKQDDGALFIGTAPFVVDSSDILYSVGDAFNAVEIETDNAGTLGFFGRGAGSLPTASAVVNDICECVTAISTLYAPWMDAGNEILDFDSVPGTFYINVRASKDLDLDSRFLGATVLARKDGEVAFIVDGITRTDLGLRLADMDVNSVMRCK